LSCDLRTTSSGRKLNCYGLEARLRVDGHCPFGDDARMNAMSARYDEWVNNNPIHLWNTKIEGRHGPHRRREAAHHTSAQRKVNSDSCFDINAVRAG
jgi:hypothetical protein